MPALIIGTLMQVFQQFTGINAIMFYAPVLFQTVGFKSDASLLLSVITGIVNVGSTFVSIYAVDKVGRRKLLLQTCVQMFISQVGVEMVWLKPRFEVEPNQIVWFGSVFSHKWFSSV